MFINDNVGIVVFLSPCYRLFKLRGRLKPRICTQSINFVKREANKVFGQKTEPQYSELISCEKLQKIK